MATPRIVVGAWPWVSVCPLTRTALDTEGIGVTNGNLTDVIACDCAVEEGTDVATKFEAVFAMGVVAASDARTSEIEGGAAEVDGEGDGAGTDAG